MWYQLKGQENATGFAAGISAAHEIAQARKKYTASEYCFVQADMWELAMRLLGSGTSNMLAQQTLASFHNVYLICASL